MNKKKQKPISDLLSTGGIAFITNDDKVMGLGDFVFESFVNLSLEKQKELIDKMDEEDEYLKD